MMGYFGCFLCLEGAVMWVYISKVFHNRVRAKGQSLGSFGHWFMNALISGIFPLLAASSGGYPFVFFSLMMGLQFFVVLFVYPETKGVSLEQMQNKLGIASDDGSRDCGGSRGPEACIDTESGGACTSA